MTVKIMIVDDNEDMRYTIKTAIETQNSSYKIVEAKSGLECLSKLPKQKPDIILMDIMMPEMSGLETVVKIKEDEKNKRIKIIFVSATTDEKTKNMAKLTGDGFIEKPFTSSKLVELIQSVLKE